MTRRRAPCTGEPALYRRNHRAFGTHEVVLRHVPSGATVLDVGCATGYLGEELVARGCSVFGVDNDTAALAIAQTWYEGVHETELENCDVLPWPEKEFDVVLAADVVEHIRTAQDLLVMLRDRMARRGRLIISLPNVAHFTIRLPLLMGRFAYKPSGILDNTHVRLYTFASAKQLVLTAGFSIDRVLGASNNFGAVLQGGPQAPLLRGLLAHNIVIVAHK